MPKGGNAGAVNSPETNRALNFRPQQPPLQNNNMMAPYGNPWGPSQMMQPRMPQMQFPGQTPSIQPQQGGMMGLNPMLIQFLQMLNQQQQLGQFQNRGGQGGMAGGIFGGMAKPQPVPMNEQPQPDVPAQSPMGPSPNLMGRFLGRKVFEQ